MKKYIPHITASSILSLFGAVLVAHGAGPVVDAQQYTPMVTINGVTEAGVGIDITSYLVNMMKFIIAASGALAIIMLVIAGTKYIASGIAPSAKNDAKDQIWNALIGLGLVLTSYLILNTINPNLVNFKLALEEARGAKPTRLPAVVLPIEWQDDTAYERTNLRTIGLAMTPPGIVQVNKQACKLVGQSNCTSVHGLAALVVAKLVQLASDCGPSCAVVITGGTEYWLHGDRSTDINENPTQHKPLANGGGKTVDLSQNSEPLNLYIRTNGTPFVGGPTGGGCAPGIGYELDGGKYIDENIPGNPPHWHVCYY